MTERASTHAGGVGLGGLLFLVFLVLKLIHVIDWSWWWVTAPLWGGFALVALPLLTVVGLAALANVLDPPKRRRG